MLGAIIGDIVGSRFEPENYTGEAFKSKEFALFTDGCRFTDDTVCTCAIANCILTPHDGHNWYGKHLRVFGGRHLERGWGRMFTKWLVAEQMPPPFNSWGNGSAMRVSPIAWAFNDLDKVLREAERSAEVTHNHPESIKGARAVAHAIWLARQQESKAMIKKALKAEYYPWSLSLTLDEIRPEHKFDTSCQKTVPVALLAFFESKDFIDCIRNAISMGGDSDTLAAIAGSIAHAYYKEIPPGVTNIAMRYLSYDLSLVVEEFCNKYQVPGWDLQSTEDKDA